MLLQQNCHENSRLLFLLPVNTVRIRRLASGCGFIYSCLMKKNKDDLVYCQHFWVQGLNTKVWIHKQRKVLHPRTSLPEVTRFKCAWKHDVKVWSGWSRLFEK